MPVKLMWRSVDSATCK